MTGIENQTGTAEAQSIFTSLNFLPNLTSLVFPNLLVHTTEGPVLGKQEWSPENRFYRSFRGIPFAQPPVGKLRFESPQPVPYWWGVRLATNFNNPCLTYLFWITLGEEDCLYINVFTPGSSELANSEGLVPVIFWVHGGSFYSGSELQRTLYLPGTFIDRGVIFVSFNYRLGPLGFMTTDDAVIPGNYGAKDMVAALYWVQRNIRKFGGDPNKVTLLGQSSGAVSAHALTLSPLTTGALYNEQMYKTITETWDNDCGLLAYWSLRFREVWPSPESLIALCIRTRQLYANGKDRMDADGTGNDLIQFSSDLSFKFPPYAAALLHSKYSGNKAYFYTWDHVNQGALNNVEIFNLIYDLHLQFVFTTAKKFRKFRLQPGRSHSDDLLLLFDPLQLQQLTPEDISVKNLAANLFISFGNTLTPTSTDVTWPEFEETEQRHISFQNPPVLSQFAVTPEKQRLIVDWYDNHQKTFPGIENIPTLAELMGL
ncbi:unnamed protein product [Notodromas monacha]|uniref:Carboxylic ester hydrolase n=1 Tax=Notodromas monacha TaxID=399045 RepID=A0A7R9GB92_9CRUS|nr:unnamed protein product [Notodromas monacha]CAG0916260.1 unnamed protein product [Notodromas monacha]